MNLRDKAHRTEISIFEFVDETSEAKEIERRTANLNLGGLVQAYPSPWQIFDHNRDLTEITTCGSLGNSVWTPLKQKGEVSFPALEILSFSW